LAAFSLPFLTLWLSPQHYGYAPAVAIFACCWMVIAKHRQNIARLAQGTELRFGTPRKSAA
jgi:glycerol-3-phosphate acyltransferase PlsY